ncbi:hypothetical protein [Methylobacterium oryzihabitans]|uniref:Uncharacterized protein n=1 Tax=Methylobacterium oryzihabitans TaxID=2499852 RepID=A0A437PDB1_9HYPH|nr:hypothetical protein [Methylobacterium oryzihabitans]RVU20252.1 hypothetical protein EOE48_06490 [Methylobacterium oryzihabitans]
MWSASDITIDLVLDESAEDILTGVVATPAGTVKVMAEVSFTEGGLILRGLHMHSQVGGANAFGAVHLRHLAQAVMETFDVGSLEVAGASRTTGANPGRRPGRLRFTRKPSPREG